MKTNSDFFAESKGHEATGYINTGVEIFTAEETENKRIHIRLRVEFNASDLKGNKAKAGSVFYTSAGNPAGKLYNEIETRLMEKGKSGRISVLLQAYTWSDRIDPLSVVEYVAEEMIKNNLGQWDASLSDSLISLFPFEQVNDTNGYSMWHYNQDNQRRMSIAIRNKKILAVIPTRKFEPAFFEARLRQSNLTVIYFEKLKPEEEDFFASYFSPR